MGSEQLYIHGFNHGYLLTKHLPDLTAKLIRGIKSATGDYMAGFFSGKEEYELEISRARRLNELRQIRDDSKERGYDLEPER